MSRTLLLAQFAFAHSSEFTSNHITEFLAFLADLGILTGNSSQLCEASVREDLDELAFVSTPLALPCKQTSMG